MLATLIVATIVAIVVIPVVAVLMSPVFRLAVSFVTGRRIPLSQAAHISAVSGVVAFVAVALLDSLSPGPGMFAVEPAAEILSIAYFTREMLRVERADLIGWRKALLVAVLYTVAVSLLGIIFWLLVLRSYFPSFLSLST